jgi:hypothetical protein
MPPPTDEPPNIPLYMRPRDVYFDSTMSGCLSGIARRTCEGVITVVVSTPNPRLDWLRLRWCLPGNCVIGPANLEGHHVLPKPYVIRPGRNGWFRCQGGKASVPHFIVGKSKLRSLYHGICRPRQRKTCTGPESARLGIKQ